MPTPLGQRVSLHFTIFHCLRRQGRKLGKQRLQQAAPQILLFHAGFPRNGLQRL